MRYIYTLFLLLIFSATVSAQTKVCELAYISSNKLYTATLHIIDTNLSNEREIEIGFKVRGLVWSPDGQYLALSLATDAITSTLTIMDADGTNPHELIEVISIGEVSWSPTGNLIAYLATDDGRAVHLISPDGSYQRRLDIALTASDFAWSQDGKYLAVQALDEERNSAIYLVSVEDENAKKVIDGGSAPAWTLDGQISFSGSGEVKILDPFSDNLESRTLLVSRTGAPVIWSKIQATEAIINDQGDIWLLKDENLQNLTNDSEDVLTVDWSSDENFIAYVYFSRSEDGSAVGVKMINLETDEIHLIHEDADMLDWRVCSED